MLNQGKGFPSRIQGQKGTGSEQRNIYNLEIVTKLWEYNPGSLIRIFSIPDPRFKKALDPGSATLLKVLFTCAAEAIVAAGAATAVQGGELVNELYQRVRHRGQGFPCLQTAVSAHKKRTF
jgi:hypothetical protein